MPFHVHPGCSRALRRVASSCELQRVLDGGATSDCPRWSSRHRSCAAPFDRPGSCDVIPFHVHPGCPRALRSVASSCALQRLFDDGTTSDCPRWSSRHRMYAALGDRPGSCDAIPSHVHPGCVRALRSVSSSWVLNFCPFAPSLSSSFALAASET